MKKISIVCHCYNEKDNLREFYARYRKQLSGFPQYDYEFLLEDNGSTDGTREVLRELAAADPKFKVILNSGNFGPVRSAFNAILNTSGDAVLRTCADMQEPPELLPSLLKEWESGHKIVVGVRTGTRSSLVMEFFRKCYYKLLLKSSQGVTVIPKFTGFGLYDKAVIEAMRKFKDPYPYFRGLVTETGYSYVTVPYVQEKRKHGKSHYNMLMLYDMAMTGFVNNTKLPLRLAVFSGFVIGALSFLISMAYLILKLVFWDTFKFGIAPIIIAQFFFASIQLIFIGIIGEYLGAVWTQVKNKPLVIEEERINFSEISEK